MRIGVNAGSLEKDIQKKYGEPTGQALLESAMRHIDILDRLNFHEFKISVKASNVFLTMDAYRLLSAQIDNPLHLGVTEAGIYRTGSVKSAIALGGLLLDGIGDTMRISLAAEPEEEVKIGGQDKQGARALWIGLRIARANNDQMGMQVLVNQLRALFPDSKEYQRYLQLQYSTEAVWK